MPKLTSARKKILQVLFDGGHIAFDGLKKPMYRLFDVNNNPIQVYFSSCTGWLSEGEVSIRCLTRTPNRDTGTVEYVWDDPYRSFDTCDEYINWWFAFRKDYCRKRRWFFSGNRVCQRKVNC